MDAGEAAYVGSAAVMLAFAAWLLYLSPRQRAARALVVLLTCIGVAWAMQLLEFAPLGTRLIGLRLLPVLYAAIGLSTIHFLSVYPRPQGLGRWRHGGAMLFLVWSLTAGALLLFPDLWGRPVVVDGEIVDLEVGPLSLVNNVWTFGLGSLLVVLALEHTRLSPGPVRRALTLIIAGFMTSALAWQSSLLFNDLFLRVEAAAVTPALLRAQYILEEVALMPVVGAAAILLVAALRSDQPERRREGFAVFALAAAVMATAALLAWTTPPPGGRAWVNPFQAAFDAVGGVVLTALAGYALLKHRLFDIDVKVKWTIRRGTVAAIFLAVFFAVSQVAQEFLTESYGWMAGGLTAGLLLFAIAPLQRVADRVATAAMPGVRDDALTPERRLGFYRTAVALALSDGVLTREEERHLARLAEDLGIGHTEALQCREDVAQEAALGA